MREVRITGIVFVVGERQDEPQVSDFQGKVFVHEQIGRFDVSVHGGQTRVDVGDATQDLVQNVEVLVHEFLVRQCRCALVAFLQIIFQSEVKLFGLNK